MPCSLSASKLRLLASLAASRLASRQPSATPIQPECAAPIRSPSATTARATATCCVTMGARPCTSPPPAAPPRRRRRHPTPLPAPLPALLPPSRYQSSDSGAWAQHGCRRKIKPLTAATLPSQRRPQTDGRPSAWPDTSLAPGCACLCKVFTTLHHTLGMDTHRISAPPLAGPGTRWRARARLDPIGRSAPSAHRALVWTNSNCWSGVANLPPYALAQP